MSPPLALVTGGARRIGRAIVERLVADGTDVVIHHHRSAAEADALAQELRAHGRGAWTLGADLRDPRACAHLVPEAAKLAGRDIDVIVHSASAFPRSTALDASALDIGESLRLHHHAPLALARSLAAQERDAAVVHVLDATRPEHDPQHFAYQTGKAALRTLTAQLARALAPRIRVNAVAPGAILEPESAPHGHLDRLARALPLQRHGQPEDVADAVAFLARAPFVTGVELRVDGGAHLLGGAQA